VSALHDPRGIWVKVDGVTRVEDVHAAVEAGVSAIGMIFAPSPRRVSVDEGRELRAAIPSDVQAFGVFDDSAPWELGEITTELKLDGIQFPAQLVVGRFLSEPLPVVLRTIRVQDERDLIELERLQCDAVHFDAYVEGQLGGTGRTAPWDLLEQYRPDVPFVLSGGLRPDNVAEGVRRLQPAGVDVSSGVELRAGIKDAGSMRAFVEAARSA
jgi:phosphoribosylanthranilate isomerase